jgi:hypothetical protein
MSSNLGLARFAVLAGVINTCLLVLGLGTALAVPITYTETATISGSLSGQSFSGDVQMMLLSASAMSWRPQIRKSVSSSRWRRLAFLG